MDADQTTPEGLRNLAQAVRKHMVYQRLKTFDESPVPKTTGYDKGSNEDTLRADLKARLDARLDTKNIELLTRTTKMQFQATQLKWQYQVVSMAIAFLVETGDNMMGTDFQQRECFVFLQALITYILPFVIQNINTYAHGDLTGWLPPSVGLDRTFNNHVRRGKWDELRWSMEGNPDAESVL